jgi:alkaline phosphatase
VHGDGVPFLLWVDLKDGSQALRDALHAELEQYPMLSVFTDDSVTNGPVTVVLTGNDGSKRAFISEHATRRAMRDQGTYAVEDTRANNQWAWYALEWPEYMTWDGTATIPDEERTRLSCLVGDVHAKGAKLRFWRSPESRAFRTVAIDTGLDLIGTDDPQALNAFLAGVMP